MERGVDLSWEQIIEMALDVRPLESFIDIDDPIFVQAHSDMPKIVRDYCIKRSQKPPQTIGEVARCV